MEKIPEILERLGIVYSFSKERYFFPCPVHGGDNKSGCTIFADDKLCWKCWTHACHEEYGSGIFGFIRGALTKAKGKNVTYQEVASFLGPEYCREAEYDPSLNIYTPSSLKEYKRIHNTFMIEPNRDYQYKIDRQYAIRNLAIPSQYFLGRGLSAEILTKFDVGDCSEGFMEGRAVTPVYDENYRFVGNGGRKIIHKRGDEEPKWKYDSIIEKGGILYGLNLSKQFIMDSGVCIIVEGQGNIWRLWEAGYPNCVGTMGAALTDFQLILLEKSGCTTVVIMMDNNTAGEKAGIKIKKLGGRRFNYVWPQLVHDDPLEHSVGELTEILTNSGIKKLLS